MPDLLFHSVHQSRVNRGMGAKPLGRGLLLHSIRILPGMAIFNGTIAQAQNVELAAASQA